MSTPDISFMINGKTIRHHRIIRYRGEHTLIGNGSGSRIEIKGEDGALSRVSKVHNGVVRAPPNAIRNTNRRKHSNNSTIWIKPVERSSWRCFFILVHG